MGITMTRAVGEKTVYEEGGLVWGRFLMNRTIPWGT
jgi:hypothetical protein